MSLKYMHIVLIILSTALAYAFGVFCLKFYVLHSSIPYLVFGLASFFTGAGLLFYLVWFFIKMKDLD